MSALVKAARAAILELTCVGIGHGHIHSAVVIEELQAALTAGVPRCDGCRWWLRLSAVAAEGDCERFERMNGELEHGLRVTPAAAIVTRESFGCVEWEARDVAP